MNGARALLGALVDQGVEVCFANPGTSEMHFVAALDEVPEMRGVLALFEGVATGAADGYARMTGRPAATLLHLGPGLGNGLANLHNARRARSPVVNIVGDHATYHKRYDAPLESDIPGAARTVSQWVRVSARAADVAADAVEAVAAAIGPPAGVATLILPADVSWTALPPSVSGPTRPAGPGPGSDVPAARLEAVASVLRHDGPTVLLVGGRVLSEEGLRSAAAIAASTGAKLLCETFPARLQRGAGRPPVERLGYFAEFAEAQLAGARHLVLVDAPRPVSFFAYPDRPSDLVPEGCVVHPVVRGHEDPLDALGRLAGLVKADPEAAALAGPVRPDAPSGPITMASLAAAVGHVLPAGAVVVDESNTAGIFIAAATEGSEPHDWLCLTGGAIGQGLPVATGAAVGAPGRQVLCLEADGSALYTLQALWTQAREHLDVTTVVLTNRSYAILNLELGRVGAGPAGPEAAALLELTRPELDLVSVARGLGVRAAAAGSSEELVSLLEEGLSSPGPMLIDAVVTDAL